jgi:hypothetical protein
MSPRFEIIEAKPFHCGAMSRLLRRDHAALLERRRDNIHRELRACFDQSAFRRAWLIDGRLAALGGVTGTELSADGMLWLALTQGATRHPKAIVVEARRQLDGLMQVKRRLSAAIFGDDDAAARLAIFLGFTVDGASSPAPAASRAGRRLLEREVKCNADLRSPLGASFVTHMHYEESS